MFNQKTTIIVGAGASKEVNLPTGSELKHTISNILDFRFDDFGRQEKGGDSTVIEALREIVRRDNVKVNYAQSLIEASWQIRDALPLAISIDNFIDAHQGNSALELCGKLAIVKSLLAAERKSLLYVDTRNANSKLNYDSLKDTWFNAFMQLLTENCTVNQIEERLSSIEFIVFNYDRCIEHFLYHSLQTYYGINSARAADLVRGIKIYHPYGMVGGLPWAGGANSVMFGGDGISATQLISLVDQIKTFAEGTDPESSDVMSIRNGIAQSQIILFLGFAYHRLNLDLIQPTGIMQSNTRRVSYFGTALGISKSDCDVISTEIVKLGGPNPQCVNLRNELNCSDLLREYWRSLSLS